MPVPRNNFAGSMRGGRVLTRENESSDGGYSRVHRGFPVGRDFASVRESRSLTRVEHSIVDAPGAKAPRDLYAVSRGVI